MHEPPATIGDERFKAGLWILDGPVNGLDHRPREIQDLPAGDRSRDAPAITARRSSGHAVGAPYTSAISS
ncbi:hypothetical protein BX283_3437 [Streptomyces sp. TLI_146]|nr:hypothetical protein BX283_3437 [Streptomyces sp. TLI_146]